MELEIELAWIPIGPFSPKAFTPQEGWRVKRLLNTTPLVRHPNTK